MQEVLTMLVEDHPKKYFNMVSVAEKYLDGVKKLPNMNFQKVDVQYEKNSYINRWLALTKGFL